jgi:hypothetical protein
VGGKIDMFRLSFSSSFEKDDKNEEEEEWKDGRIGASSVPDFEL